MPSVEGDIMIEGDTMNDRITIEGRDGAFGAYIARPKTLPAPAVVVLQELFGVTMAPQSETIPRFAPANPPKIDCCPNWRESSAYRDAPRFA